MPEPRGTCLCLILDIEPAVTKFIPKRKCCGKYSGFNVLLRTTYATDIAQARRGFEKIELLTSVS